jgi:hypothetical protein
MAHFKTIASAVHRARSAAFIHTLRNHVAAADFPDIPTLPIDRELFVATLDETYFALSEDPHAFAGGLAHLCSLFASPHELRPAFCSLFLESPLASALIDRFDDIAIGYAAPLLTELFVNISAIDDDFAHAFLCSPHYHRLGYEKTVHVRDSLGPSNPIPLLLAYNLYSRGGVGGWALAECFDLSFYTDMLENAADASDGNGVFFASLVLSALLRSGPIPTGRDTEEEELRFQQHSRFLEAIIEVLRVVPVKELSAPLWAVYFWFQQNWEGRDLWNALTPKFVRKITRLLTCGDRLVVRLTLQALAWLWLIPDVRRVPPGDPDFRARGRWEVSLALHECCTIAVIAPFAADDDPEISAVAFVLLGNFVAFDRGTFVAACESPELDIVGIACRVLVDGVVKAKCQAALFLCTFFQLHMRDELKEQEVMAILPLLIDTSELDDDEVSTAIFGLCIKVAREIPRAVEFLLEIDFDAVLDESKEGVELRDTGERLRDLLEWHRNGGAVV